MLTVAIHEFIAITSSSAPTFSFLITSSLIKNAQVEDPSNQFTALEEAGDDLVKRRQHANSTLGGPLNEGSNPPLGYVWQSSSLACPCLRSDLSKARGKGRAHASPA
jgi:hypothetical protein